MLLQIFLRTFFDNEEYDDFQAPIDVHRPPLALSREQRDIEEATRLSLQARPAAESGESSSSAVVRPTPRITRSSVAATLEKEEDFQEPVALRTRTARTLPPIRSPVLVLVRIGKDIEYPKLPQANIINFLDSSLLSLKEPNMIKPMLVHAA